jgi:hypothetical protein
MAIDLRSERGLEVAEHESNEVVGRAGRNRGCVRDDGLRNRGVHAPRNCTTEVSDILRYFVADAEIKDAALDDVLGHHPTGLDGDTRYQAAQGVNRLRYGRSARTGAAERDVEMSRAPVRGERGCEESMSKQCAPHADGIEQLLKEGAADYSHFTLGMSLKRGE